MKVLRGRYAVADDTAVGYRPDRAISGLNEKVRILNSMRQCQHAGGEGGHDIVSKDEPEIRS